MKIKIFKNFPRNIDNPNRKSDSFLFLLKIKIAEVNVINDGISPSEYSEPCHHGIININGKRNSKKYFLFKSNFLINNSEVSKNNKTIQK